MELPLKTPITLFARVMGEKGERELRAILSTGATYSWISLQDARQLGYLAYYDPTVSYVGEGTRAVTASDIVEVPIITLKEVRVGDLIVKDVEAVAYNLPRPCGVNLILGANFLKNFTITLDYKEGVLRIEQCV